MLSIFVALFTLCAKKSTVFSTQLKQVITQDRILHYYEPWYDIMSILECLIYLLYKPERSATHSRIYEHLVMLPGSLHVVRIK